eukprot:scaffold319_cov362-Pavlova_lutheri.AAC.15
MLCALGAEDVSTDSAVVPSHEQGEGLIALEASFRATIALVSVPFVGGPRGSAALSLARTFRSAPNGRTLHLPRVLLHLWRPPAASLHARVPPCVPQHARHAQHARVRLGCSTATSLNSSRINLGVMG